MYPPHTLPRNTCMINKMHVKELTAKPTEFDTALDTTKLRRREIEAIEHVRVEMHSEVDRETYEMALTNPLLSVLWLMLQHDLVSIPETF